jgi:hypothetical protein
MSFNVGKGWLMNIRQPGNRSVSMTTQHRSLARLTVGRCGRLVKEKASRCGRFSHTIVVIFCTQNMVAMVLAQNRFSGDGSAVITSGR